MSGRVGGAARGWQAGTGGGKGGWGTKGRLTCGICAAQRRADGCCVDLGHSAASAKAYRKMSKA